MSRPIMLPIVALVAIAVSMGFATRNEQETSRGSSLITLYAHDNLTCTFNFEGGRHGGFVAEGEIRLDDAQIAYDVLEPHMLTVGFVQEERCSILDLGQDMVEPTQQPTDLSPRPPMSVFHTLFVSSGRVQYVGAHGRVRSHRLGTRIMSNTPPKAMQHVQPQLGHTYLMRYRTRSMNRSEEHMVKFQIIDLVPGEQLTMRWARI